ncbi:hypothetical protein FRB99_004993 [Tulasnella sp. 403]|nr:hypothetical protein FRB99_004993 [Tulasnella sp. 403]
MPPKRPLESSPTSGAAKESKRAKTRAARTIDVEAPPARLPSASTSAGVNVATPASSIARPQIRFTADSLKGLPNAFEVEKFVEARSSLPSVARSFEIGAMQRAMENVRPVWDLALSYFGLVVISSGDASKRVWQTLPRHMRRRTASHDVRRVPVRLRVKALAEMDPMKRKKKLKTLRKIGKAFEIGRTARLLKRQRDKAWLETHIWHAKRMKMENLWGYRLALHPTEKAFRSSYRASTTTSILHDSSYYGILELSGPENVLKEILTTCCDPFAPVTAPSRLWDASVREKLAKPKYKKAELDARRSKNLVPGTPLQPLPSDDRIPLIIVQRTIGASASSSRHTMRSMNGFLILFPAGWSMPFLTSLTHTGTRVGGLRERRLQRFESGIGSWPEDFIGVGAIDQGKRTAEVTRQKRKVKKGHFGDGSTYPDLSKSDWAVILGLQSPRRVGGQDQAVGDGERRPPGRDLIPTQPPPDASAMEELLDDLMRSAADLNSPLGPSRSSRPGGGAGAQTDIRSQIWLLRGSQAPTLFQNLATYATQKEVAECLWDRIDKYRVKRGLESLSTSAFTAKLPGPGAQVDERSAAAETLLNTALVAVRIQMCGAGVVGDSAVIYDDPGSGDNLGADEGGTHDNSQGAIEPQPEPASILGYVTTGHVSLQQGKGFAIGMVSLKQLVGIARRDMLYVHRLPLPRRRPRIFMNF